MNTTNLFVELLVIGVGPAVAVTLFAAVVLGPDSSVAAQALSTASLIPILVILLAAIYVLGIVVDRLADRTFAAFGSNRIRRRYFDSDDAYHNARRTIILRSEAIYRIRQYGRSRIRICRGWALNLALLLVPANLYVIQVIPAAGERALLLTNGVILVTLLGTVFSWYSLVNSEYRKIKGAAEFIRAGEPDASEEESPC